MNTSSKVGTDATRNARPWVNDSNVALLLDLYELRMAQAYWKDRMFGEAVFSLFTRRLPQERNYLVSCGLADVLEYLEHLHFSPEGIKYLRSRGEFSEDFLQWLGTLRFTGDVYAMPEGTILFADEPVLEIVAPLPEGQLIETFLLNQVGFQTVLASKASRVVVAARERSVVDFGIRRMFGTDAALKSSRAFHIAGVNATSNVLAGDVYGIPIAGTMAHSYIQAHDDELEAFRSYATHYPETILLVDTYDTLEGVRKVVRLARELGEQFRVTGIRLDSGDLASLAKEARRILDEAGLNRVSIVASSGLDEYEIARLLEAGAPINAFGVGTAMGVSADAPTVDLVYKLAAYEGRGRLKSSPGKRTYPGRKQVFRRESHGRFIGDTIARDSEKLEGMPLMRKVMAGGKRLPESIESMEVIRRRVAEQRARLPQNLLGLAPADPAYPVRISDELQRYERESLQRLGLSPHE